MRTPTTLHHLLDLSWAATTLNFVAMMSPSSIRFLELNVKETLVLTFTFSSSFGFRVLFEVGGECRDGERGERIAKCNMGSFGRAWPKWPFIFKQNEFCSSFPPYRKSP